MVLLMPPVKSRGASALIISLHTDSIEVLGCVYIPAMPGQPAMLGCAGCPPVAHVDGRHCDLDMHHNEGSAGKLRAEKR